MCLLVGGWPCRETQIRGESIPEEGLCRRGSRPTRSLPSPLSRRGLVSPGRAPTRADAMCVAVARVHSMALDEFTVLFAVPCIHQFHRVALAMLTTTFLWSFVSQGCRMTIFSGLSSVPTSTSTFSAYSLSDSRYRR